MNRFLSHPRLPEEAVSVALVSGEYPWLGRALEERGIAAVTTMNDRRLPRPVGYHPDLQVCPFSFEHMFVLQGSPLRAPLEALGFTVEETNSPPGDVYPGDALCGGFLWEGRLVGNSKSLDRNILAKAVKAGFAPLHMRQGYGACSVALVDKESAITGDPGMYRALTAEGFHVLQIHPGEIQLPGYAAGFIGGCCGKLAPDVLAFTGALSSHRDGRRIREFLHRRGVCPLELRQGPLLDVGGIVPLLERTGPREGSEKKHVIIENEYFL